MMKDIFGRINKHLLLALAIGLGYHGGLLFYTFRRTYDALIHIFFADHYARTWFDHWNYRWYTGFPMTSYPPGSHMSIALLSKITGLETAFVIVFTLAILLTIIGVYRFSCLWVSERAAGYAALLAVFSSSLTETMHVFGQLPTIFSLGFLLNALPYAYRWVAEGKLRWLLMAWAMSAATTAGHHVTTLFGAVFFVAPTLIMGLFEHLLTPLPDEPSPQPSTVTRSNWRPLLFRYVRRTWRVLLRMGVYTVVYVILMVAVLLPYWLWSATDPIAQVAIPHASRDSFLVNLPAGFVFWLVPYGMMLLILPYVFYKGFTTKAWPLASSLLLLFVLGTGGTTPIPRFLLRGAFDILTLDRFTFWATIALLPFAGEFVASLIDGRLSRYLRTQFNDLTWRVVQGGFAFGIILLAVFIANLTQFRAFQPAPINIDPIVAFLEKDQHWRWRYMTLGFGDQMAWLSANTTALSVEGNYHSARRLPELTTTPVERLDGAKFRGIPGIGSLQQFLAVPEKYNLKFIFSIDEFYDPILYFSGWHRLGRLENGVMVWEREDIPPLPEVLPRKEIPLYQRLLWGSMPPLALSVGLIVMTLDFSGGAHRLGNRLRLTRFRPNPLITRIDSYLRSKTHFPTGDQSQQVGWQRWLQRLRTADYPLPTLPDHWLVRLTPLALLTLLIVAGVWTALNWRDNSAEATVVAYYDDLDFRRFGDAYARLDPATRPSYEQYLLDLSSSGGLLASYAKLDAITTTVALADPTLQRINAHASYVTSLNTYTATEQHDVVQRDGRWYIQLPPVDPTTPPEQLLRREAVRWFGQGRRQPTASTTAFGDVQDRPELQIISARLVQSGDVISVVGELINTDVDPADVTVTALLYAEDGSTLSQYNAQSAIMHKLLPKELTPFRVDFEGVAGQKIVEPLLGETDAAHGNDPEFDPLAFTPLALEATIDQFAVYAKAVVTTHDLDRTVGTQALALEEADGQFWLTGRAGNAGTQEATLPQMLVTYYDEAGDVVWVDHHYLESAIRPQRLVNFRVPITPASALTELAVRGDTFTNLLDDEATGITPDDAQWQDRLLLPDATGYASLRVSLHYFVRGQE